MWSLYDGQDVLNEVDPQFSREHPPPHRPRCCTATRSTSRPTPIPRATARKRPQDQDPDMLLHVVRETDNGIVVRGAKYETAAAYANQAFVKPTIANWGDGELSDYALGFICRHGLAGDEAHLPHRLRRPRARPRTTRCPTASTRSTRWSSSTTSRSRGRTCSSTATPARPPSSARRCTATARSPTSSAILRLADMLIGAALLQRAPDRPRAAAGGAGEAGRSWPCYREGINAHLTAAIALAEERPAAC